MNKEAFMHAIRVLEEVKANQIARTAFDLSTWLDLEDTDDYLDASKIALFDESLVAEPFSIPHKCGTTACAVGYMGLDPWFRSQGLQTHLTGELTYTDRLQDRTRFNWGAVAEMFSISISDAEDLFQASAYDGAEPTVEDVLDRVRNYVQQTGDLDE